MVHTNRWQDDEFYQDPETFKKESNENSRIENKMVAIKNSGDGWATWEEEEEKRKN